MKGFSPKQYRVVEHLLTYPMAVVQDMLDEAEVSHTYSNRGEFILRLIDSGDLHLSVTDLGAARLAETHKRRRGAA